jgi:hypothetical protein
VTAPAEDMRETAVRDLDVRRRLLPLVAPVLLGSPFQTRSRWPSAVVALREEERRITSRSCFAQWLATNDLVALSHECIARRVPSGSLLVYVDLDLVDVATTGFLVLDVDEALSYVARRAERKSA